MATFLPLLSTIFIATSGILVAIGWYQILKGRRATHQKFMVTGAIFALLFFIIYVSRTIFIGNTAFSETAPVGIRDAYYIFLICHIIFSTTSAVFGIVTLTLAFKQKFAKHKKVGRYTATMWLITAPSGVMVYILLYIMYPGGTTKPVIDAIFGW
ncbi:MAG: rane protein [Bacilli bacterium]|jgi:putative membrane protein|nr:rane protein [Bacilli bacterium]